MNRKRNLGLYKMTIALCCTMLSMTSMDLLAQDATEIVRKANDKMEGVSSEMEMVMTIVRPTWQRTVSFKSWSLGRDYSLTLITAPSKESGQTFLKLNNDMWSWNPTINRMIKLPPSMMSQGWMGSDYSNDDILKESSIVVDYHHTFIGSDTIGGFNCYQIQLDPKEEAAVVWGKILMWISKEELYQLRVEYFDEDGYLVKTHLLSDIKFMYDRKIPTHFEIIPEDKPNQKTLGDIKQAKFDIKIPESFFSQQNMQTVK